jgi:hypothetical protein
MKALKCDTDVGTRGETVFAEVTMIVRQTDEEAMNVDVSKRSGRES